MKYWSPILNVVLFYVLLIVLYNLIDMGYFLFDQNQSGFYHKSTEQTLEYTVFKLGQSKSKSEMKAVLEVLNKKNQWSGVKAVGDDLILEEMIFHYQDDSLKRVSLKFDDSDIEKYLYPQDED